MPAGTSASELKATLESELLSIVERPHPPKLPPVKHVSLQADQSRAFVEFNTIQDAEIALSLRSVSFNNATIIIDRHPDYTKPPSATYQIAMRSSNVPRHTVTDAMDKVCLGGLPKDLGHGEVFNFVSSFGAVKEFNLVADRKTGRSFGVCFFKFVDQTKMMPTVAALNNFMLSGHKLECEVYQPKDARGGMIPVLVSLAPTHAPSIIPQMTPAAPTRCIALRNMVLAEDLVDDEEVQEILEDTKEECQRYGGVETVVIPRPRDGQVDNTVGQIFVLYADLDGAKKAAVGIDGRKFDNRTVTTEYVLLSRFEELRIRWS